MQILGFLYAVAVTVLPLTMIGLGIFGFKEEYDAPRWIWILGIIINFVVLSVGVPRVIELVVFIANQ